MTWLAALPLLHQYALCGVVIVFGLAVLVKREPDAVFTVSAALLAAGAIVFVLTDALTPTA